MLYQFVKSYFLRLVGPGLLAVFVVVAGAAGAEAAGVHITGTVTNQSGAGVQNVSVTATDPGGTTVDFGPSFSDSDGSYQLDVDPGTYDFHFDAPSGSGLNPVVFNNFTVMTDQVLSVQFTPVIHTLSGTVRDADGQPISGVRLSYNVADNSVGGTGTSDGNGHYSIQLSAGVYGLVGAQFGGYSYSPSTLPVGITNDLTTGDATAQDVYLPRMVTVTTLVKNSSGNPVSNASVTYSPTFSQAGSQLMIGAVSITASSGYSGVDPESTNASGISTFKVPVTTVFNQQDGALAQTGNICTYEPNTTICLPGPLTVSGDTTVTLVLPVAHTLSGTVRDADGHPASGVQLSYNVADNSVGGTGTSDSNGHYSMQLPAGVYGLVDVRADGYFFNPSTLPVGITNDLTTGDVVAQDVYLPHMVTVSLLVNDSSGSPASGASVTYSPSFSPTGTQMTIGSTVITSSSYFFNGGSGVAGATTNASGISTFKVPLTTTFGQQDGAAAQKGNICAYGPNTTVCLPGPLTVSGDTDVTLVLPSIHSLSGTVRDADGQPVSGVRLSYNVADNSVGGTGTSDSNGHYSMQLPAGVYGLVGVQADGYSYSPSSLPVGITNDLTTGDATAQDVYLPRIVTVTVLVKDGSGSPVNDASVTYSPTFSQTGSRLMIGATSITASNSFSGVGFKATDVNGISTFKVPIATTFGQQDGAVAQSGNICTYEPNTTICLPGPLTVNADTTILFQPQPAVPDMPSNLSAVTPTKNAPALTWSAVSGAVNYRVYRDGSLVGTVTDPNFVDSALNVSGSYSYAVVAVNANNVASASSAPFAVVYDKDAPVVSNVGVNPATIVPGGTATLSAEVADNLSGVLLVEYFEGTDPGQGSGTGMIVTNGVATAVVGSNLGMGVHTLSVRAQDGLGTWSGVSTVQLTVNLAAPTNLHAMTPTSDPVLGWTAVSGADHYDIYRDGTKVGTSTTVSFTDSAAANGTHSYYVKAVTAGNVSSGPSNTITVLVDKTQPTITYAVSPAPNTAGWNGRANVNPVNTGKVTVTFTCGDGTGGSQVQSCSGPMDFVNEGGNQTVTGTAVDNAGNTATVTALVKIDRTIPTAGALSWSANPMAVGGNTTLTVPVSDALSLVAGGEYFLGTDPGVGNGTAMTLGTGNMTATFGSTLAAGVYTVGARSRDNAGNWSNVSTGTLTVTLPAPVITGGPQLIVTPKRPVITWNAVATATSYQVYRNGVLIPGSVTGTNYTDNGATATGNYSYTVVAVNGTGARSAQSAAYVVVVLPPGNTLTVSGNVLPVAPQDVLPNFVTGRRATFNFRATNQAGVLQPTSFNFTYGTYTVNATSMQWVTIDPNGQSATVQGLASTKIGNAAAVSRAFRLTITIGNPQHFKLEVFNGTTFTTVQYHVDENNAGDVINYQ